MKTQVAGAGPVAQRLSSPHSHPSEWGTGGSSLSGWGGKVNWKNFLLSGLSEDGGQPGQGEEAKKAGKECSE